MQGYQVRVYAVEQDNERSQFFPKLDEATEHFNNLVADPTWKTEDGDHVVILKIINSHHWTD